MSTVFLSIGQCGNQLASSFIDYCSENESPATSFLFNHYDDKFHFVHLDSEVKVTSRLAAKHGQRLRTANVLNTKCGRGSNWASGYTGLARDGATRFIADSIEAIRRETERCDFLLNFNLMHSLSGGTGSGCGSKLLEQLRDEFGAKKYIFTQSVAPFSSGELPLQHYNNLLCLSHLHEFADAIMLFQNDDVFELIEKSMKDGKPTVAGVAARPVKVGGSTNKQDAGLTPITLTDMNAYIVKCLLGSIFPVQSVSLKEQSTGMEFLEMQRLMCSNPLMKIVEVYNVNGMETLTPAQTANRLNNASSVRNGEIKSNPLLKSLIELIPKYDKSLSKQFSTINSLIISRGHNQCNSVETLWQDTNMIRKCLNPVDWNPFPIDFWHSAKALTEPNAATKPSNRMAPTSLTVALNRNRCVEYLRDVELKAAQKFTRRAYLHWYSKFGVGDDMFENAFQNAHTVIDTYEQMTRM